MKKIPLESDLIEWKKSIGKEITKTVVAMSNSKGGKILIGIEETKDKNGNKKPKIIGFEMTADEKLSIQSSTGSCMPKINVNIKQIKANSKSIVAVLIPEGRDKPYCTGGGRYLFREEGRNKVIDPSRMRWMFLEKESKEFLTRFKEATKELERQLYILDKKLREIGEVAENAESLSDEAFTQADVAATASEEALQEIKNLKNEIDLVSTKLANIEKDISPQVKLAHQVLKEINLFLFKSAGKSTRKLSRQLFNLKQSVTYYISYREPGSLEQMKELGKKLSSSPIWNQKVLIDGKAITFASLFDKLIRSDE